MKTTITFAAAAALLALAACSKPATNTAANTTATNTTTAAAGEPVLDATKSDAPAGTYKLDPAHSTVVFRLSHLGFSKYTAGFSKLDGDMAFDPAHPEQIKVSATIDAKSLALPTPPAGFHDTLTGKDWLDAGRFPTITFKSTKVEKTGPNTANVTGDFTLHGVTKPVVLQTTFNGGYAPNAYDGARVGFSAKTTLKRSDFGLGSGIPAPGSNMGVGDHIDVTIETEWNSGKPTAPAPSAPPKG